MKVEWVRWGRWCAHLHIDGEQACTQPHGGLARGARPARVVLTDAEISPSGTPYGRVCERCSRRFRQLFFRGGRIVLPESP